ncbi:MAG: 2-C-methyl-D-erythritol 4-phosphate cytidylyltransferase [Candidatus Limivicinus sp.]|jgi:2-C-methyl-D-erythritol 4-phosphate cytidylyltransferase
MNIRSLFKKKDKMPHCSAVIVAGGSSQRMGTDKLLAQLGCMPVLARTLLAFQNCELVDEIVVVARMEKVVEAADLCKKYGISKTAKVVCGGSTRMESALAGVSEVRASAKLIAIHDGARPFVTDEVIRRTVIAADKYTAAVPVLYNTDTLKLVDENGVVVGPIDRDRTARVQTPQIFNADLIKGALTKAVNDGLSLTDDCSAIEIMGVRTHTVPGDENNIKLTTPRDMKIADLILKDRGDYYEDRARL